jgi:hypothetical protein
MRRLGLIAVMGLALLGPGSTALAKDMDDKIDQGDGFEFDNTLKKDTNVRFTKVKSKAAAKRQSADSIDAGTGDTNINSAVVGGNVYGDIVIIDEGKGNKNVVKGK